MARVRATREDKTPDQTQPGAVNPPSHKTIIGNVTLKSRLL